jgi:hypothetical protein
MKGANAMNTRSCTHFKVNGVQCGSPALRGAVFCYFHQRMFRGVCTPPDSRLHPIALIENPEAIQAALMEIINALIRNHIDIDRARLILRSLRIAAKNANQVDFGWSAHNMVQEVPEYPAAPLPAGSSALAFAQAEALAHIKSPEESSRKLLKNPRYKSPPDSRQSGTAARSKNAKPAHSAPSKNSFLAATAQRT